MATIIPTHDEAQLAREGHFRAVKDQGAVLFPASAWLPVQGIDLVHLLNLAGAYAFKGKFADVFGTFRLFKDGTGIAAMYLEVMDELFQVDMDVIKERYQNLAEQLGWDTQEDGIFGGNETGWVSLRWTFRTGEEEHAGTVQ